MILHATYQPGRCWLGSFDPGDDLREALQRACGEIGVWTAFFQLTGSVSEATFGVYDLQQRVYITERVDRAFEILACSGNISAASLKSAERSVNAGIVLADNSGNIKGGRLFSPTIVFAAEFVLQELIGGHLPRSYDPRTGMQSWSADNGAR
jgi:predicted DNA-binding protein with PD1-like motif